MNRMLALSASLACLFLLAACGDNYSTQIDLGSQPRVFVDQAVEKLDAPVVNIQPDTAVSKPMTAIFFPFRVRQDIENRKALGREIGRMFWQEWLHRRVGPTLAYMEQKPWPGGAAAAAEARVRGADLAIGGDITHLLAGGSVGDTEISLHVEVYDATTGDLIWSLDDSGRMTNDTLKDWILFAQRSRLPTDPLYAITTALARDMGVPVKAWLNPEKGTGEQGDALSEPSTAAPDRDTSGALIQAPDPKSNLKAQDLNE